MDELEYWLKGEREQNFGDYLSEYIAERLFIRTPRDVLQIRTIGSFLEDWFVQQALEERPGVHSSGDEKRNRMVAWGGGIRERGGMSPQWREKVEILSVRGPISASELRLGTEIPLGDPALVLPALYEARPAELYCGRTLCIPHFHDRRTDHELRQIAGADVVLRPNIDASDDAVERFIDAICASRFVLTSSLHGAIVAAAYRKPFAFWDPSGVDVDVPIKWQDFAGSVGIQAEFLPTVQQGMDYYESAIAPNLRVPPIWRAIVRSPYLLNPEAVLRILRYELKDADPAEIDARLSERIDLFQRAGAHFSAIADESRQLIGREKARADAAEQVARRNQRAAAKSTRLLARLEHLMDRSNATWREVLARDARINALDERVDAAWQEVLTRDARIDTLDERVDAAWQEVLTRDARIGTLDERVDAAWQEVLIRDARIDALDERINAAWREVAERDGELHRLNDELAGARQHAASALGVVDAMRNSRSWRITAPYRAIGAVLKAPRKIGSTGLLFRLVLGVLMLLPAMVYCGGLQAAYKTWRRTPNFTAHVLGARYEIYARLDGRPPWLRRLVLASFSAGYRVYANRSVSRTIAGALKTLRNSGWQGLANALRTTAPGGAGLVHIAEDEPMAPAGREGNERRALVVDYRIPRSDTSAGELATVGIVRDLVSMGFDVTFASNDMVPSPRYEAELRQHGVHMVTNESGFAYAGHFIDQHGADFGLFYIFRYDVAENVIRSIRKAAPAARVIFHAPDLYFLREMREARALGEPGAIAKAEETRRREVAIMSQSDHVVLVSPAEVPHLRKELGADKPISVFPVLYASIEERVSPFRERKDIFFLGGFGHKPNVSAVEWFVEHVWPTVRESLPDARFHIVGAEVPEGVLALERIAGVKVVGFVPDLQAVMSAYRVGVAPLLFGAGIKGKVAATMGAGIPCVCTEIAAEGMGIENEIQALVESDAARFAAAVVRLYQDEALWSRLSANGQALVRDRFGEVANRGALSRVLNEARALPIDLWRAYCERDLTVVVPTYPAGTPIDVSVIVPAFNKWPLTRACIASVVAASAGADVRYELIVADDASSDETRNAEKLVPGLRVVRTPGNLGFLRNCNNAAAYAQGRYILLLNNDTVVLPGWLNELVDTMDRDESIAIAGSKLLYPDGRIQEAGGGLLANADGVSIGRWLFLNESVRPVDRDESVFNFERETDYVTGASIIVRSTFWRQMDGFDNSFKTAYCEDSDLAMSARAAGFRVVYQPKSEVVHLEHQSYADGVDARHAQLQQHNKALLLEKWAPVFARDHLPSGSAWWEVAARGERAIPPRVLDRRSKTESLNILYFSPFPSHPSNHGNQATIQQFARRLQMMGHRVHFVLLRSSLFDEEAANAMRAAWDTLDILPNNHPLGANGEAIPFDGWYGPGTGEQIRALCARYDIDVALCSYIFQSKMLEYVPSYILRIIDTHDKMGDRYEMLRERGLPLEFFSCTPEEEGAYLRRADVVFARRREEADYFNSVTGRNSAIVVPHFEEPRFDNRQFDGLRKVAIVASANRINLAIVREFLQAIERQLDGGRSPIEVLVAGQVKDMAASLSSEEGAVFGRPWVQMLGYVEDIGQFYESADLVVSPVTIGTGINVKTVQAMAYGMPLLTTTWGSKGIETAEPLHRLADLGALVEAMFELVTNPQNLERLAASSREAYQRFFDSGICAMGDALRLVPRSAVHDFKPIGAASLVEWRANGYLQEGRENVEATIMQSIQASPNVTEIRATCCLCGIAWMTCTHQGGGINWRETMVCPHCQLNNRMRAVVHLLSNARQIDKHSHVYITEQKTRLFEALRSSLFPRLVGSEFLGDRCALGSELDGLRNEDLTRLTFKDGQLDAVLTFDVLEHVPNYRLALHEIYRCLRPGGRLVATAPFDAEASQTLVRAVVDDAGHVEHLLPPEYHGDPLNAEQGILCFQTFGWNLLQEMQSIGFVDTQMVDCWNREYGYLGKTLVLVAAKPPRKDASGLPAPRLDA